MARKSTGGNIKKRVIIKTESRDEDVTMAIEEREDIVIKQELEEQLPVIVKIEPTEIS